MDMVDVARDFAIITSDREYDRTFGHISMLFEMECSPECSNWMFSLFDEKFIEEIQKSDFKSLADFMGVPNDRASLEKAIASRVPKDKYSEMLQGLLALAVVEGQLDEDDDSLCKACLSRPGRKLTPRQRRDYKRSVQGMAKIATLLKVYEVA